MAIRWPHPIRIFRAEFSREHDLSLNFTDSDIYGEDKWARLAEDESAVFDVAGPVDFAVLNTPARLYAPSGLDLQVGYYLQIKKPVIIEGKRGACTTYLSEDADTGAVEIEVVEPRMFQSGDQILLDGDNGHELSVVSEVGDTSLSLYSSHPLSYDYVVGEEVTACHFYRVTGRVAPQYTSPIQVLTLVEILGTRGV